MAVVVNRPAAPLAVVVDEGPRPALAVAGNADYSNISKLVCVLDRLADERERCVSLDLAGVESIDAAALAHIASSASVYKDRQLRLHLKETSVAVREMIDRHALSDIFCEEECRHESCPGNCGVATAAWEMEVFTLPCRMEHCAEARARVNRVAETVGFGKCRRDDIALAVGEAVANAIRHGGADSSENTFTVSCLGTVEKVSVTVSDGGPGFSIEALPTLEEALFQEHGRGVHCMRTLMDEVVFDFSEGTTVRMVKLAG